MKKLLLAIAMVAFGFTANAQDGKFNLGGQIGLPTEDGHSFVLGLDANYLFNVSDGVDLGVASGLVHYFGEEILGIDIPDYTAVPIGGAVRFDLSDAFVLGGDLGYMIGVSDNASSEFYYRPMLGYNVSENTQINASYTGIDGGGHFGVGVTFGM